MEKGSLGRRPDAESVPWTPKNAALTGLSLLGVVLNLTPTVLQGRPFVDVLVRDVGPTLSASGVALDAAREG